MRIPTNSNFSKEIAKRFETIFHQEMSLGGLQDLQEQLDLINPVDTYLQKQVSQKMEKDHECKTNVQSSRTVRSTESEGKRFVEKTIQDQGTKKGVGI